MDKYKTTFKQIFELTMKGEEGLKKLQEIAPIDEATLAMIIDHLPTPHGGAEVQDTADMARRPGRATPARQCSSCDAKASTNIVVFHMMYDQHSGEVAVGRVFSGRVKKGVELTFPDKASTQKVQQVGVYMGPDKVMVDQCLAGNIAALVGLKDISVGHNSQRDAIEPFEQIVHYSKPVVTKAIEPKDSRDTTKLIEALRVLAKQDPTIKVEINQETGEHLVSGMGELHLEIVETKLRDDFGVPITTSEPIVVYLETIDKKVGPVEGKTPNRHSKFFVTSRAGQRAGVQGDGQRRHKGRRAERQGRGRSDDRSWP